MGSWTLNKPNVSHEVKMHSFNCQFMLPAKEYLWTFANHVWTVVERYTKPLLTSHFVTLFLLTTICVFHTCRHTFESCLFMFLSPELRMQSLQALLLGIESQPSNVLGLSFPKVNASCSCKAKNELRSKAKCWDVAGRWILLDTMLSAESEFDSDLRGKLNGMACWDWPFAALKSGCWWGNYFSRIIAEKKVGLMSTWNKHEKTHTYDPVSKHRYGSELQSHLLYFDFDEGKGCFQAVAFIKPPRISWITWASFSLETTAGITVAWC